MDHHLIVRHPFGDYARGDTITDAAKVAGTLATAAGHVIRVAVPASPPAAPEVKPAT